MKLIILFSLLFQSLGFTQVIKVGQVSKNKKIEVFARIQNLRARTTNPMDIYDPNIYSPKSVKFSKDGDKIFINSLEGFKTVIYDWPLNPEQEKRFVEHRFNNSNAYLFQNDEATAFNYPYYYKKNETNRAKNTFNGKPVESALSPDGKYLWVPYYRRDFDPYSQSPSAVSIIDTQTEEIVRVMPTGPIPKYVVSNKFGTMMAVTNWGDNTVSLIDTSAGHPSSYKYIKNIVIETQLDQGKINKYNRDSSSGCGFCLRGTVFTDDGRFLIVARMGGNNIGLAVIDLYSMEYIGTITGLDQSPRHVIFDEGNHNIFVSLNATGKISKANYEHMINSFIASEQKYFHYTSWNTVQVGSGTRTIELANANNKLFAAVNNSSKLVMVNAITMEVEDEIPTDPFTVGLDVSKDGNFVITTSQGKRNRGGGNSVNIFKINN